MQLLTIGRKYINTTVTLIYVYTSKYTKTDEKTFIFKHSNISIFINFLRIKIFLEFVKIEM